METKKIIAIAFSDLHISLWSKFNKDNQRTLNQFRVLSIIRRKCIKAQVPALSLGDMFHKPDSMDPELLDLVVRNFSWLNTLTTKKNIKTWKCYAISGNHDMKYANSINKPSVSWLTPLSGVWLEKVDFKSKVEEKNYAFKLHGVPYIDNNIGVNDYLSKLVKSELDKERPNILLLHTDYTGARDTNGMEVKSNVDINSNLLNMFDLVLMGHIHKPQRLSKKIYMVGATNQQRRTDIGCDMGYWEIYSDMSMKFKSLSKKFPRFIDVEDESKIKGDGNYYTVVSKKLENSIVTTNKITTNLTKKKLANKYMREKGIKDKSKKALLIKYLEESDND